MEVRAPDMDRVQRCVPSLTKPVRVRRSSLEMILAIYRPSECFGSGDGQVAGLLVCSASTEEVALAELCDVIVEAGLQVSRRGLTNSPNGWTVEPHPTDQPATSPA